MSQRALRTAFAMAFLCTFGAGVLLFLEPANSASFWISVWTFLIAVLFLITVIVVIRVGFRQSSRKGGDARFREGTKDMSTRGLRSNVTSNKEE